MSRRFGRNQKRALREAAESADRKVAAARKEALQHDQAAIQAQRREERASADLRQMVRDIEQLLGRAHVSLPERVEESSSGRPWNDEFYTDVPLNPFRGLRGFDEPLDDLPRRHFEVLKALRVEATRDEVARACRVLVRWGDTRIGYSVHDSPDIYLSRSAWDVERVVTRAAEHIGREVAKSLAEQIRGGTRAQT